MATRDISEAYCMIPLHHSQWPAAVVHVTDDQYCIDTCMSFRVSPSTGAYDSITDAGLDIFRSQGIGPTSCWVNDHFFF